ncbi:MAG: HNH endonuclease [Bacteroidia bacterium]|jgi:hypothetical protein|nr:HNH endonuclease [Bacteroidia bacterium]
MAKKNKQTLPQLREELTQLIKNFDNELLATDLRIKVLSLVAVFNQLREIGKSLIDETRSDSARNRILRYFIKYPKQILSGDEFLVVSGIQEYARRIRELRVQEGWTIISGKTAKEIADEEPDSQEAHLFRKMAPDDYILLSSEQDRDAAHRWYFANSLRNEKTGAKEKILRYFRKNVGQQITSEELRYISNDKSEWARRVRELRTEEGWPIVTKSSGNPDLPVGVYILEEDRQSPAHDRVISDTVRIAVLRRDNYKCVKCGWSSNEWDRSTPRHLELHHIKHHVEGGANTIENLITVCTVCHDEIH